VTSGLLQIEQQGVSIPVGVDGRAATLTAKPASRMAAGPVMPPSSYRGPAPSSQMEHAEAMSIVDGGANADGRCVRTEPGSSASRSTREYW